MKNILLGYFEDTSSHTVGLRFNWHGQFVDHLVRHHSHKKEIVSIYPEAFPLGYIIRRDQTEKTL